MKNFLTAGMRVRVKGSRVLYQRRASRTGMVVSVGRPRIGFVRVQRDGVRFSDYWQDDDWEPDISPSKTDPPNPIFLNNRLAYRLGLIACEVGQLGPNKCGDEIDRGLIMQERLHEAGFLLSYFGPPAD